MIPLGVRQASQKPTTARRIRLEGWDLFVISEQGAVRPRMEDAWAFHSRSNGAGPVIGVFDGIGGHPNGGQAASAAAASLAEAIEGAASPLGILAGLNAAVLRTGGGTTAALAMLPPSPGRVGTILSVGDGNAWAVGADGNLEQLTRPDVSRTGALTDWLGRRDAGGSAYQLVADVREVLLCTDGVDGVATNHEMRAACNPALGPPSDRLENLWKAVQARGAPDNATMVLAGRS